MYVSFHCAIQVSDPDSGQQLRYEIREPKAKNLVLGKPLHIALAWAPSKGERVTVRIDYETSSAASDIQFVPPPQTCGKKHGYIFTQFQAIHARSGIPHQDTPAAKITYTARLTVPAPLRALMSANPVGEQNNGNGTLSYDFSLDVPIPSYLIAIAVGDLHSKRIGPRSLVWTGGSCSRSRRGSLPRRSSTSRRRRRWSGHTCGASSTY